MGNLPLLPVKCASRTSPAALWTGGDANDPVDEAISVFRANVFYRFGVFFTSQTPFLYYHGPQKRQAICDFVTGFFVFRNYEVKGGGDRVLLCVAFLLIIPFLHSLLFSRSRFSRFAAFSQLARALYLTQCAATSRCLSTRFVGVCYCCFAFHLNRFQCLRVAEKSKSAKDCERDLVNKAQV